MPLRTSTADEMPTPALPPTLIWPAYRPMLEASSSAWIVTLPPACTTVAWRRSAVDVGAGAG